jgi:hypothetical protein
MARWDKIVEYFHLLENESDRLKVINMGPSTEGNPFLAVIISAPENLNRLDHYKAINQKITDRLKSLATKDYFTNDLKYLIVRTIFNGNKQKFNKLMMNPAIIKMTMK